MKFSPEQLYRLAAYVKKAITEKPLTTFPYIVKWEEALKKMIDADSTLPNYDELDNDPALDWLIDYYC